MPNNPQGFKIYNLIGGGYFDEIIIPFIDIFKAQYEEKYIEKIENTIKNLKIEDHYSTKDNHFTSPTGLKVQIFEIKTKEKK